MNNTILVFYYIILAALAVTSSADFSLFSIGFKQLRVRHLGKTARIELGQKELSNFTANIKNKVNEKFIELGFQSIHLDPKGYRMGSLNEVLKEKNNYV